MVDLNELSKLAFDNAEKRMNNGANISVETRKMLKHCSTEVIEAMEAYSILCYSAIDDEFNQKKNFSSELADIICCVLIIAKKENIDIEKAVLDCIEKNRKRAEMIGDKK